MPMTLKEAQDRVWQELGYTQMPMAEAMGKLLHRVSLSEKAFGNDQWVSAQTELEESFAQLLLVSRMMGIDLDRALMRVMTRHQEANVQRVFVVFQDRVEIQVAGEKRGGWPLYTEEDYQATLQVAQELRCDVVHQEVHQLGLFEVKQA